MKKRERAIKLMFAALCILISLAILLLLLSSINLEPLYGLDASNSSREDKIYIAKDLETCSRIKFQCSPDQTPFFDSIGCGCEKKSETKSFCDPDSRPEVCTKIYQPVCGWFKEGIQCIKYPCASTYGNNCEACRDSNVNYYTPGVCPE